jgi:hypothetical protein
MPRVNSINFTRAFIHSAGALLLASALVRFVSCASDQTAIHPHEPVFMLALPTFFRVVAGLEFAIALVCLFGKDIVLQTSFALWLATSLMVYRIAMVFSGATGGFNGYSGNITDAFGVSHRVVNALLETVPLYLLAGSLVVMAWSWWHQCHHRLHPAIRMSCPACGIHIEFASQYACRKIPCPHCQTAITLRKPENLKMSCFFCQEHIEFPAHAIGEKIPCPHCKMDITLKESG